MHMNDTPFKHFGIKIKELRLRAKESIVDVCGAVEADENIIKELEAGKSRPSEELLFLLISHFALKEDDALKLWELAGYEQQGTGLSSLANDLDGNVQKAYVSAGDVRILYTDMVHIKANNHGVVLNFLQSLGPDNHNMAVARIGMSQEHAKTMLKVLQQTIKATNPKKSPKSSKKDTQE